MSILSRKTSINVFLLSINLILLAIISRVVIADETTNAILEQSIYLYYYESDDALLDVSQSQIYTFAPIPGEAITIVSYGLDDSALTSISLFDNNGNLVATGTNNQVTEKPNDAGPSRQSPFITAIEYTANSSGLYYFEVKTESGESGLIRTMLFVGDPFNTDLTLIDELNPLLPSKAFMVAGDPDREWENELTGETIQGLRTEVDVLPIERIDRAPDVFLSYSTLSYLPDVNERLQPVTFDRWFNEDDEEIYLVNIRPVPEKETDASRAILEDLDYQTYNSNNFFFFEYLFSVGNGSDPIALDRGAGACAGLADRIDCISNDPNLGRDTSNPVDETFEAGTIETSQILVTGDIVTVTIDRTQTCTSFGGNTGNSVTIASVSGTTSTTVCLPSRYIPPTGDLITTGITAPASGTQNVCEGTSGNDVIACTTGDDWIDVLGGDDAIFADAGNDDIFGGSGVDFIVAGAGDDNVDAGSGYDEVDAGEGNDNINLGANGGIALGGTGADTFIIDSSHSTVVSATVISGGTDFTATGDGEQDTFLFDGNPTGSISLYTDSSDFLDFTTYGSGVTVYPDAIAGSGLSASIRDGGLPASISGSAFGDTFDLDGGCIIGIASGCSSTPNYNISGNAGDDVISTSSGNDTIDGGDDNDTINSGDGNDTIIMNDGDGNDSINAGNGTDLIDGISGTNALIVILNNATGSIEDTVTGDIDYVSDVENVNTGSGDDQFFISDSSSNIINAGDGDDVATVSGGFFTITVNRTGDDVAVSAFGIGSDQYNSVVQMNVSGSAFNDTFVVSDENDNEFNGLGGIDSIDYATTSEDITVDFYTTFTATVSGTSIGTDTLINFEQISTDSGDDNFIFDSNVGTVTINSRAGNDEFDFDDASGTLTLNDSSGSTFLDFTDYTDGATIDLGSTSQQTVSLSDSSLLVTLSSGIFNNVSGSAFADSISGTVYSDTIYGGAGVDQIYGESGNDFLYGGDDNDQIYGGFGNDTIDGGEGNDDIDGGFGTDFIDESGSTTDLVVTLSDIAGVGNIVDGAEVDTVDNVENIDTGSGLDTFIMSDSSNNIINAGGGDDVATVTGGAGTITVLRDGEDVDVSGSGVGIDQYNSVFELNINGTVGNETVNLTDENDNTITGGGGTDTVNVNKNTDVAGTVIITRTGTDVNVSGTGIGADVYNAINTVNVAGTTEDETFYLTDENDNTITGNGGIDIVNVSSTASDTENETISIIRSASNVAVTGNFGIGSDNYNDVDQINITAGGGDDTFSIFDSLDNIFDGGDGVDTANYAPTIIDMSITLDGSSTYTITGTGIGTDILINIENINTGSGNDTIIIQDDGDNDINGGGGTDEGTSVMDGVYSGVITIIRNPANVVTVSGSGFGTDVYTDVEKVNVTSLTGDDVFRPNDSNDNDFDADGGTDWIDYSTITGSISVNVNLSTGTATGDGNDTLTGFENISGSIGDDTLTGDGNANIIDGYTGNDIINAGGGDDTIIGGAGNDDIDGGAGTDNIDESTNTNNLIVSLSNVAGAGYIYDTTTFELDRVDNVENVNTGSGNDQIYVNDSDDNIIDANGGTDIANISGGTGTITITRTGNDVTVSDGSGSGGIGNDTYLDTETVNVAGTGTDDTFIVDDANDNVFNGLGGDDTISYAPLATPITVTIVSNQATIDAVTGIGNDTLYNIENIETGSGDDYFDITGTVDYGLNSNTGADIFDFNGSVNGTLSIQASSIGTHLDFQDYNTGVTIDLSSNTGTVQTIGTGLDVDLTGTFTSISGSAFIDNIVGTDNADLIYGGAGADIINAGDGDDVIYGGAGNDDIDGGDGTELVDNSAVNNPMIVVLSNVAGAGYIYDTTTFELDRLDNIENVNTGSGNDQFSISDSDDNIIDANGGTDIANVSGGTGTITITRTGNDVTVSDGSGSGGIGDDTYLDTETVNVAGTGTNDTFVVDDANDNIFNGLGGDDTISYAPLATPITVTIVSNQATIDAATGIGNDTLYNIENIETGSGDDYFDITGTVDYGLNSNTGADIFDFNASVVGTLSIQASSIGTHLDFQDYNTGVTIDLSSNTGAVQTIGTGLDVDLTGTFTSISGSAFVDNIVGTDDADLIYGGAGADTLIGGDGDDVIYGGAGNDNIDGGDGTELIDNSAVNNPMIVVLSNVAGVGYMEDTVTGEVDTLDNIENINTGSGGDQFFISDSDDNTIDANGGTDEATVTGGTGTINITRAGNNVTVSDGSGSGGIGDDTYLDVELINVSGSATDDIFIVDDANDNIFDGDAGDDTISYAPLATPITVTIVSNQASISATAGIGADTLYNFENIETGTGDDYFDISGAVDYGLYSNTGADIFDFSAGVNGTLDLGTIGSGSHLDFQDYGEGITIDLNSTADQTIGTGLVVNLSGAFTSISGTAFADTIGGTDNDDIIYGGAGNDIIFSGAGNDTIDGGAGTDLINETSNTNDLTVTLSEVFGAGSIVGGGDTDTIDNIENIDTGSGLDTFFVSDSGNNIINAGGDNDVATVTGGSGIITITRSGDDVDVSGTGIGTDEYNSVFELNVTGSATDDTFVMDDENDNTLDGDAGNDTISYSPIASTIVVTIVGPQASISTTGIGNDTLISIENIETGSGDDTFDITGTVDYVLNSNSGADIFDFNNSVDGSLALITSDSAELDFTDYDQGVTIDLSSGILQTVGTGLDISLTGTFTTISGSDFGDNIVGTSGADTIFGGAGNDIIDGGAGDDDIDGGNGTDTIDDSSNTNDLFVVLSNVAGVGYIQDTTTSEIDALDNIEDVDTGSGDDQFFISDSDDNTIDASLGTDEATVTGGTGIINITRAGNNVTVSDGSGSGGIGDDNYLNVELINVNGSGTDDTFVADDANDNVFDGLAGNDTISYAPLATPITVTVVGNQATISAATGIGADTLYNIENIFTGTGDDYFDISGAVDYGLNSNSGADIFYFNDGVNGTLTIGTTATGSHLDFSSFTSSGINIDLSSGASQNVTGSLDITLSGTFTSISGTILADDITGTTADDTIWADSGADTVFGGAGDDTIYGGAGADIIDGGADNDTIDGGAGDDDIDGGAGIDFIDESSNSNDLIVTLSDVAGVGSIVDTVTSENDAVDNIENIDTGSGADTFNLGDSDLNIIDAGAGTDTVNIQNANDILVERSGNNVFVTDNATGVGDDEYYSVEQVNISGTAGDDVFQIDDQLNNIIDGQGGTNEIDYSLVTAVVNVNVLSGGTTVASIDIGTDTIIDIQNLTTGIADDFFVIEENSEDNVLDAGVGNDTATYTAAGTISATNSGSSITVETSGGDTDQLDNFETVDFNGSTGDDTFIIQDSNDNTIDGSSEGSNGDTYDASFATNDIVVNTGASVTAVGTDVGTDTLVDIENITTGAGDDTFIIDTSIGGTFNFNAGEDNTLGNIFQFTGDGTGSTNITITSSSTATDVLDFSQFTGGGLDIDLNTTTVAAGNMLVTFDSFIDDVIGTDQDDTITGNSLSNNISGGAGNDTINYSAGDDVIDGGSGDDSVDYTGAPDAISATITTSETTVSVAGTSDTNTLTNVENIRGTSNDDTFVITEAVSTTIDAQGGTDTVDYSGLTDAINVDLDTGVGSVSGTSPSDDHTLQDVEDVIGSTFDDTIVGNSDDNNIDGNDGNDVIDGGDGDDVIDGGAGTDTVTYQNASSGVDVDLDAGNSSGGGGNDTLSNIENVSGSTFDDNITGTDGTNVIYGGEGDDDIYGLDGDDTLYGGSLGSVSGTSDDGSDNIYGGDGDDTIYGGNNNTTGGTGNDNDGGGSDVIEGGNGDDTIHGGNNNSGGGSGNDGDDTIEGGDGDDTIHGGNNNSGGGSGNDGDDTLTDVADTADDTDVIYGDNNNTSGGSGDAGDDTIDVQDGDGDDDVTGDNQVDSNTSNDPGTDTITRDSGGGSDSQDNGDGT